MLFGENVIKANNIVCNLCESDDSSLLFEAADRLHGFEGNFTYVKCNHCGLVYMNPQISSSEIEKYYPQDYAPYKSKIRQSVKKGILSKLRNYRKNLFSTVKILPFVKRNMTPETRLLDVGCGSGRFLMSIHEATGCRVEGIDISEQAVNSARDNYGIEVFCGDITESAFSEDSFDIITAWWYLEHVPRPSEVLRTMYRFLKKGGYCIISVPNIDSFNGRVFKDKWYHLDCPRHLFLYSPKTISGFLKKTGFTLEKIVFDKTAWGLFHSCRYYFGNDDIPLKKRKHLHGSSLIKKCMLPFTFLLALFKKSDTIVIYARKLSFTK